MSHEISDKEHAELQRLRAKHPKPRSIAWGIVKGFLLWMVVLPMVCMAGCAIINYITAVAIIESEDELMPEAAA